VIKSVLGKDLDPLIQRIFPFLFRRHCPSPLRRRSESDGSDRAGC
jgi:hypothetical protein